MSPASAQKTFEKKPLRTIHVLFDDQCHDRLLHAFSTRITARFMVASQADNLTQIHNQHDLLGIYQASEQFKKKWVHDFLLASMDQLTILSAGLLILPVGPAVDCAAFPTLKRGSRCWALQT